MGALSFNWLSVFDSVTYAGNGVMLVDTSSQFKTIGTFRLAAQFAIHGY